MAKYSHVLNTDGEYMGIYYVAIRTPSFYLDRIVTGEGPGEGF